MSAFIRILIPLLCLGQISCDKSTMQVGLVERYATAKWFELEARRPPAEPCTRPVLRGKALPGSGTAKLTALLGKDMGAKGVAPRCRFKSDDQRLFYLVTLSGVRPGHTMLSEFGHQRRVARAAGHPITADPRIAALAKACRPLVTRVREAVRHTSVCAPFRPGWQGIPGAMSWWPLIVAIQFEARLMARAGDPRGAFELLADGIRFTQDLSRGGATAVQHFWALTNGSHLLWEVETLLNDHRPLPAPLLKRMERELKLLAASEPKSNLWLPSAMLDLAINDMLPKAMPHGWVPPGGWSHEGADVAAGGGGEEAAVGTVAIKPLLARIRKACPKGSGVLPCIRALDAMARKLVPGVKLTTEALQERANKVENKGGDLRRTLPPYLQALYIVMHRKYHLRTVNRAFYLGSLRLRLAYRQLSEKLGRCPGKAAFERPPLQALRTDVVTGKPFDIRELEPGHLRIAWPKSVKYDQQWPPITVVRCPY